MSILIIGGTGTVGSEVVERLAGRIDLVAVMSRRVENVGVRPKGVQGRQGDMDEPGTLVPAMQGIERLVLITPNSENEVEKGKAAVRAAKSAGVKRIVYLSVHDVEKCPQAPHFASKIEIQKTIEDSGLSFVFVMPNNFYQNDYWYKELLLGNGIYPQPIGGAGLSRVDVRDIADAIAIAVTDDSYEGRYPLVGPDVLTGEDTAGIWGRHLGRDVRYGGDDLDAWARQAAQALPQWMVDDFVIMYRFFQEQGLRASEADLARQIELLDHPPRSFDDFVAETAAAWR